jgi:arylsulfatase B
MISRLIILSALCALCGLSQSSPNIVIILADDLGWADVSFNGGEIKTPNIDSLAAAGARLERFYVAPICSPTRAGLMTGRQPIRFGAMRAVYPPWREGGMDISEVTLPEVMAHAGYTHRGIFGKWHLGHSSVKYHPMRRGFTEFVGHLNGAIDYFTHHRDGGLDWFHNYEAVNEDGYATDLIAKHASAFIRKRAAGDDPFLCYIPFNAPHSPFQAKPEHLPLYQSLQLLPGEWNGKRAAREKNRHILGSMIASLDESIGEVLKAIDDTGVRDNTLVWFFSDNGGVPGIGDNRPLRGAKFDTYEGGIRVAAAVRWPGRIETGSAIDLPIANIDVLPTLMRIAGLTEHGGKPLDGIDVLDVLTGKANQLDRKIYSYYGQQGPDTEQVAVIDGEWKLVVHGPDISNPQPGQENRSELFRMDGAKPEEQVKTTGRMKIVKRLLQDAKRYRALQPKHGNPPYAEGREGFQAPKVWTPKDI